MSEFRDYLRGKPPSRWLHFCRWLRRVTAKRILVVCDSDYISRQAIARIDWAYHRLDAVILFSGLSDCPIRVYDIDRIPQAGIDHIVRLIAEAEEKTRQSA